MGVPLKGMEIHGKYEDVLNMGDLGSMGDLESMRICGKYGGYVGNMCICGKCMAAWGICFFRILITLIILTMLTLFPLDNCWG